MWAASSAGRALRSQCRGRGFDPPAVHHFPNSQLPNSNGAGPARARGDDEHGRAIRVAQIVPRALCHRPGASQPRPKSDDRNYASVSARRIFDARSCPPLLTFPRSDVLRRRTARPRTHSHVVPNWYAPCGRRDRAHNLARGPTPRRLTAQDGNGHAQGSLLLSDGTTRIRSDVRRVGDLPPVPYLRPAFEGLDRAAAGGSRADASGSHPASRSSGARRPTPRRVIACSAAAAPAAADADVCLSVLRL